MIPVFRAPPKRTKPLVTYYTMSRCAWCIPINKFWPSLKKAFPTVSFKKVSRVSAPRRINSFPSFEYKKTASARPIRFSCTSPRTGPKMAAAIRKLYRSR